MAGGCLCFEGQPHGTFEVAAALTEGLCGIVEQALGDANSQQGPNRPLHRVR